MTKVFNTLNTLIQGEQMAVELYGRFIHEINDANARTELTKIRETHTKHLGMFTERIVAMGGTPEFGTGIPGTMSKMMQTIKMMSGRSDREILEEVYSGEHMGITAMENAIREPLDSDSLKLAQTVIGEDKSHLAVIDGLVKACVESTSSMA